MDEVLEKQLVQRQEDVNNFCNDIRDLVNKYEGRIPADIGFTQFSFWAQIMMNAIIQAAQTPPVGETH